MVSDERIVNMKSLLAPTVMTSVPNFRYQRIKLSAYTYGDTFCFQFYDLKYNKGTLQLRNIVNKSTKLVNM